MPLKDTGFAIRAGTPRLRQYIERQVAELSDPTRDNPAQSRGDAAQRLGLSPAELSNFSTGTRTPTAQKVLGIVCASGEMTTPDSDFEGTLDQQLIESGHAPVFFSQLLSLDQEALLLRMDGDYCSPGTFVPGEDLASLFSNIRFAGRSAALQIARVEGDGNPALYLLLEPATDDTDVIDGDIVLCSAQDRLFFARFARENLRVSLTGIDPLSLKESAAVDLSLSHEIELLARIILQFRSLVSITDNMPTRRLKARRLDHLHIGIAPFQDALLPMIGLELGFFENEGILLNPERIDWYDWSHFLKSGSGNAPRLVFANLFSFVKEYYSAPDLRYLYGANLFDNGFHVLTKRREVDSSDNLALMWQRLLQGEDCKFEISTILESDWAAQLFSFCQQNNLNLSFASGRGLERIYPTREHLEGRGTIIIRDTLKSSVEADPEQINKYSSSYLGSLPQRLRLFNQFNWEEVSDLQLRPSPVNGFVGTVEMLQKHSDVLMRFLRVWFRIVNYIRPEILDKIHPQRQHDPQLGSRIVQQALERMFPDRVAKLEVGSKPGLQFNEVVDAWGYEKFPISPAEIEKQILSGGQDSAWKKDATRAMEYLEALLPDVYTAGRRDSWAALSRQLTSADKPSLDSPFALELVHSDYVSRYGMGICARSELNLDRLPYPELLYATRRQ